MSGERRYRDSEETQTQRNQEHIQDALSGNNDLAALRIQKRRPIRAAENARPGVEHILGDLKKSGQLHERTEHQRVRLPRRFFSALFRLRCRCCVCRRLVRTYSVKIALCAGLAR